MTDSSKIEEQQLHQIWIKQDFINDLEPFSGESISILNPGDYNKDTGGPDFKHARIKIGNFKLLRFFSTQ